MSFISNLNISAVGEKSGPKHKFFTGKFADLQMRSKRSRFSRLLSKFLSYIRPPVKGLKKIHNCFHISNHMH